MPHPNPLDFERDLTLSHLIKSNFITSNVVLAATVKYHSSRKVIFASRGVIF